MSLISKTVRDGAISIKFTPPDNKDYFSRTFLEFWQKWKISYILERIR